MEGVNPILPPFRSFIDDFSWTIAKMHDIDKAFIKPGWKIRQEFLLIDVLGRLKI